MEIQGSSHITERPVIKRNPTTATTLGSDESSLISCGSTTVSLLDSESSDLDDIRPVPQQSQRIKAICLADRISISPVCLPSASSTIVNINEAERQVLLDAGPAPPDYAQAMAQRSAPRSLVADEESLIDVRDDDDLPIIPPKWKGARRFFKQHWKKICLLNLAIYCILTTIVLLTIIVLRAKEKTLTYKNFPAEHPVNNFWHPEQFHRDDDGCRFTSHSDFDFFIWQEPNNFHIDENLQLSEYADYHNVDDLSISGNIDIRPAPLGQYSAVEVIVSFAASAGWRTGFPQLQRDPEGFRILPSHAKDILRSQSDYEALRRNRGTSRNVEKACLSIWIGVYVQTPFNDFNLQSENLEIDIGQFRSFDRKQAWSFRVSGDSEIHTNRGNITTSYWDARNANVTSDKGSLKGIYGLNNNINLESKSGDIEVDIWQSAAEVREYLDSHPKDIPANLTTTTGTGKQTLRIFQEFWPTLRSNRLESQSVFLLNSTHSSDTGTISIEPEMYWEGKIHAKSSNGSIDFHEDELHFLPDPVDGIAHSDDSRHVWAERGTTGSLMRIETREGDINLCAPEAFWECDDYWQGRGVDIDSNWKL